MPTINYAKSIIYLILDKHTGECYIGSTATSLAKRMYRHREALKGYNKWIAGGKEGKQRGFCYSYTILARNQYTSFELERYPCNDKRELRSREGYYIDKYRQDVGALCLNKRREGVNRADDVNAYSKQHYQANKDSIKEKYQANKDDRLAYQKAYNQRPYTCPDCNKILTLGTKYYHTEKCKVREARLQQEQATTESLTENWWEEKESTANSPTTIVRFTNKQPLYMNTKHSVWSSVGLVFA